MEGTEARIRELLLRARDLEQEVYGLRAEARRLIRDALRPVGDRWIDVDAERYLTGGEEVRRKR